jgi:hypothetical protein
MAALRIHESYRKLARAARRAGWTITSTRSGHLAWKPPSGRVIYTPATPSDRNGVRNHTAQLRRAGLAVR